MLQGTFLDYYLSRFLSWGSFIDFISFGGPMWFLRVLLIFTAIYTLWRQITKLDSIQRRIPKQLSIPRYSYLLLLAIVLGCLTFIVRIYLPIDDRPLEIPWGQLIQYLLMFSIGVISVRYLWFEKITKKHVKIWLITIIISLIIIYIDFIVAIISEVELIDFTGGANFHSFLMSLVDNIICMGVIFILIKVFYAKFNKQGTILRNLSVSAYHMYLVHPPVLVVLSLSIAALKLHPLIKIGIVFPSAVLICYLISHYVLQKISWKKHDRNTQGK
jgi:glucan biosynthesis protein C